MLKHVMLSRIVPVNEEVNVVEPITEEEQSPVEVGFDICGTDPKLEIHVDQSKPRIHLNIPCVLKRFTSLMLMRCCIR
jgi:hypothetical protein